MPDYIVKPETKRSQDLMATLDKKKVERETLVSNLNKLKLEFENNLRKMEKDLAKHDESITQIRAQLRAEILKVDPDIFKLAAS